MTRFPNALRSIAITFLLGCCVPAHAKMINMNDITVDVPTGFKATAYDRGMETQTPDEEVFVWFETYKGNESDALVGEHDKYWQENDVVPGEPTKSTNPDDATEEAFNYKSATWKGKPTVLRYLRLGPYGSEQKMILVTIWASPEGAVSHKDDIGQMIKTLNVTYTK